MWNLEVERMKPYFLVFTVQITFVLFFFNGREKNKMSRNIIIFRKKNNCSQKHVMENSWSNSLNESKTHFSSFLTWWKGSAANWPEAVHESEEQKKPRWMAPLGSVGWKWPLHLDVLLMTYWRRSEVMTLPHHNCKQQAIWIAAHLLKWGILKAVYGNTLHVKDAWFYSHYYETYICLLNPYLTVS